MTQINFIATPVQKPTENVQGKVRLSQTSPNSAEQFSSQTGSGIRKFSEHDFDSKVSETLETRLEEFSFNDVFKLEDKTAQQFTQFLQKDTLPLKAEVVPGGQENLSESATLEASHPEGRLGTGNEMPDQPPFVDAHADPVQNYASKVVPHNSPEQTAASITINPLTNPTKTVADNTSLIGANKGATILHTGLRTPAGLDSARTLDQTMRPSQNTTFPDIEPRDYANSSTAIHSGLSTKNPNVNQGRQPEIASAPNPAQETLESSGLQKLADQPSSRQVSLDRNLATSELPHAQDHRMTLTQPRQASALDVTELASQSKNLTLRNDNTAPNSKNTIPPPLVKPEGEVLKVRTSQYNEVATKSPISATNVTDLSQSSPKSSTFPFGAVVDSTSISPKNPDIKPQRHEPNTPLEVVSFSKTETQKNTQNSLMAPATNLGATIGFKDSGSQLLQTNHELVAEADTLKSEFVALETSRPFSNTPTPPVYQHSVQSDIARSIAQQLAAASNGDTHKPIELALSPEELGRVKLTFSPNENGMAVSILAERPETLELMRKNIDSLAQEFLGIGYDQITFAFNQSNTGQNQNDQQNQNSESPQTNDLSRPEHEANTPVTINLMQSDRIDIRI